ncbi:reverse transcriptase [Paramuricea clavata]|uniref:Reverse transcriptase n=1 Tax=Paramuricea clavata TaxID=317549 RepID=A0A6S7H4I4_PARCT|nr:reverse transcriptase [Paramuricea clavata]
MYIYPHQIKFIIIIIIIIIIISAALSNVLLPHNKFGLNIILPSTKFLQCQTVSRKALKSSPNEAINNLWKDTSNHKNVQYDKYKNTKDVLNTIRKQHEDKLQHHLISQGSFFSNIIKHSTLSFNSIWSSVQSKLPKNIFNFTIRYINNTLPTRKNLLKWGISPTSECSFCLNPESLLHVVAGCKTYLNEGRFMWRHDSVLNFIASILKSVNHCNLYADLPGYISPSVITGDELRPDLLITLENKCIYILELTVGFESNLTNATRKRQKYQDLINEQLKNYEKVKFVNLSISSLGVFSHPSLDFTEMLKDLKFDEQCRKVLIQVDTGKLPVKRVSEAKRLMDIVLDLYKPNTVIAKNMDLIFALMVDSSMFQDFLIPACHLLCSFSLFVLKNKTLSLKYCDRCLSLKPEFISGLFMKGLLLYENGKHEDAIQCFQQIVVLSNDMHGYKSTALNLLGCICAKLGKPHTALLKFRESFACHSGRLEALYNVAVVYHDIGELDLEISLWKYILKI